MFWIGFQDHSRSIVWNLNVRRPRGVAVFCYQFRQFCLEIWQRLKTCIQNARLSWGKPIGRANLWGSSEATARAADPWMPWRRRWNSMKVHTGIQFLEPSGRISKVTPVTLAYTCHLGWEEHRKTWSPDILTAYSRVFEDQAWPAAAHAKATATATADTTSTPSCTTSCAASAASVPASWQKKRIAHITRLQKAHFIIYRSRKVQTVWAHWFQFFPGGTVCWIMLDPLPMLSFPWSLNQLPAPRAQQLAEVAEESISGSLVVVCQKGLQAIWDILDHFRTFTTLGESSTSVCWHPTRHASYCGRVCWFVWIFVVAGCQAYDKSQDLSRVWSWIVWILVPPNHNRAHCSNGSWRRLLLLLRHSWLASLWLKKGLRMFTNCNKFEVSWDIENIGDTLGARKRWLITFPFVSF